MNRPVTLSAHAGARLDRLARLSERVIRVAADARLGIGLLVLTAIINAAAAAAPRGAWIVATPAYLLLLGLVVTTGMAAVALRAPIAWREWRRPTPVSDSRGVLRDSLSLPPAESLDAVVERVQAALHGAGYRVVRPAPGRALILGGVRRGWSHFAGLGAHVAIVVVVVGAGIGLAFGRETTFSLLAGDQELLDQPRPGLTDAVRLDGFDAAFGSDGRPKRLDTHVTFVHNGVAIRSETLQVNAPGAFDGYLVHAWTYGPAVRVRATTLAGRPLLDAGLPLDAPIGGADGAFAELPTLGLTLGISLVGPGSNTFRLTVADATGLLDSARVAAGGRTRLGPLDITVGSVSAYVTFLSRRDPGMGVLFAGAALLVASLAISLWLPRRRLTVRFVRGTAQLTLRGGRLDDAGPELERLRARLTSALGRP